MYSEAHIKRQATRQDYLPSAQLAGRWGQMNWIVYGEEKNIFTEPTRAAKAGQKLVYRHNEPKKRAPFICTPWVPIWLRFNN